MVQPPDRRPRIVELLFGGSLVCALAAAVVAYARDQLSGVALLALVALALAGEVALSVRLARGKPARGFVSLALLVLLVAVPELGLRAAAFRHESGIEFGYPRPEMFVHYVRDERLFWTLDPARPDVNALGFAGPEIAVPKPQGTFRVLFLGDSCTAGGYPRHYPWLVEERFARQRGARPPRVECVSLSLEGYSSHQGRVLAETRGAELGPDAVVVYYGWNDHWRAWGARDAEKVMDSSWLRDLVERCRRGSRLLQLALWAGGRVGGAASAPLDEPRVTEAEYRDNLLAIARVFDAAGAPVVLITAPTAHRVLGVPGELIELGFAGDRQAVLDLHARYNDVVRALCGPDGPHLLDLAAEVEALPPARLGELFTGDGIHLLPPGRELVAERVARLLAEQFGL